MTHFQLRMIEALCSTALAALLVLCVWMLSGCSAMTGPNSLSASQLKAIAADKNASAICSQVTGMWGTGKVVSITIDKGSLIDGDFSVDDKCTVTMHNAVPPRVPKQ